MPTLTNSVKAAIAFFFGFIFVAISYYAVPGLINIVDDTLLKSIFWVGYVVLIAVALIVNPVRVAMGE